MSIHRVRYGGQNRPYWEPKCYQNNDGLAVEATAYALHTLFLMEGGGVTMIQGTILRSRKESERSEQFLVTECFLTCFWRFLIYNKLEQLEFKLEKIVGI